MSPLWRVGQATSVVVAVGVVGLLSIAPEIGLFVTWYVLVPVVPATLLIAPQVWRNLCPIATVHQLPARIGLAGTARLSRRVQRLAPLIASLGLFAIVPLRLTIFNENGPALAAFMLAVLACAFAGALMFRGKSGWCATFCPVLPVERLYGHRPIVEVPHAFCASCSGCVGGCYDLGARRSLRQLVSAPGGARRPYSSEIGSLPQAPLYSSSMGLFAAAFPGFVFGYFTAPATGVLANYGWIFGAAVLSLTGLAAVQAVTRLTTLGIARLAAAVAAALYYWYTVPSVAQQAHEVLAIPPVSGLGLGVARAAFIGLAVIWFIRVDPVALAAAHGTPVAARSESAA